MNRYFLFFSLIFLSQCMLGQTNPEALDSLLMGHHLFPDTGKKYRLQPEVAQAFEKMKTEALEDGIEMEIVSSFRSYATQKKIWNRKFKRFTAEGMPAKRAIKKIIEYSTLPGTSRHHWGTDIDLILKNHSVKGDVLLDSLFHNNNPFEPLRLWMEKNASAFGFYLVYDRDSLRKGFQYEPWHYSYKKISKPYLAHYIKNNVLEKIKKDTTVLGHRVMDSLFLAGYKEEHILGIHPQLKFKN